MIASIEGRLAGIEHDAVIIQVGGVGLRVRVPATFLAQCGAVGSSVSLYTYLHVRESELTLYGCARQDELQTFKLLLGVSGVGPKAGLAMLSNLSLERLHAAIANEQTNILTQVPGIGTKTAQKIILDLKDQLRGFSDIAPVSAITAQDAEVIAALVSLGYSVVEAQTALQGVPLTVHGVEERLRAALSYLGL